MPTVLGREQQGVVLRAHVSDKVLLDHRHQMRGDRDITDAGNR